MPKITWGGLDLVSICMQAVGVHKILKNTVCFRLTPKDGTLEGAQAARWRVARAHVCAPGSFQFSTRHMHYAAPKGVLEGLVSGPPSGFREHVGCILDELKDRNAESCLQAAPRTQSPSRYPPAMPKSVCNRGDEAWKRWRNGVITWWCTHMNTPPPFVELSSSKSVPVMV